MSQNDLMINTLMTGLATGIPVAITVGLAVMYKMFRSDREYSSKMKLVGKDGFTALMCAAWARDTKSAKEIIEQVMNVNINDQDSSGMTALMHACLESDSTSILDFLISAGALTEIRNAKGQRAIDIAYNNKHKNQVLLLNKFNSGS